MQDLLAQLDPYSVYTRPVCSGWICIVFIRDREALLDLYSIYTRPEGLRLDRDSIYARPVGSVGSV